MSSATIHTLNARDSVYLDVMGHLLETDPAGLVPLIESEHAALVQILSSKGVSYAALRSALVPRGDRREAAFCLDWSKVSGMYGEQFGQAMLALLPSDLTCSFLHGDLVSPPSAGSALSRLLAASLGIDEAPLRSMYMVYMNNLSDTHLATLDRGLRKFDGYLGFLDCSHGSFVKNVVSANVSHAYVKTGRNLISADAETLTTSTVNNIGWVDPRFPVFSINDTIFSTFLSYKIERQVRLGDDDLAYALGVLGGKDVNLDDFTVSIAEAKMQYLRDNKSGLLQHALLADTNQVLLASLIQDRLAHAYLYNLRINEYQDRLFNVMVEVPRQGMAPFRLTVSLKYQPSVGRLDFVTMT